MADRVKGITVEIGGDTTGLNNALSSTNKEINSTKSELSDVERLLKLDPTNTELLEQKQRLLAEQVSNTKDKLETLKQADDQLHDGVAKYDEWKAKFDPINTEITETKSKLKDLTAQQAALGDENIETDEYRELQAEVDDTKSTLKELQQAAKDVSAEFGDPISHDQYDSLQREIIATEASLKSLETQAESSNATLSSISAGAEKVSSTASSVASSTAGITVALVAAGTVAFNAASSMEENQNKVTVAFGESAAAVEDFASASLENYGIAESSALDMASSYGDLATSMGLSQESASDMSTTLVGLSGDLASFKNVDLESASNALNGIFTGETESLKSLGVVMTEDNLLLYAMQNGLIDTSKSALELEEEQIALEKAQLAYNEALSEHGESSLEARDAAVDLAKAQATIEEAASGSLDSLSEQEKIMLRYDYVLASTTNAQGDFANTSDSAANSIRTMQESSTELATAFGTLLLPIITPIIQKLTEGVQWFTNLDTGVQRFILVALALVAAISPVAGIIAAISSAVAFFTATPLALTIAGIALLVLAIIGLMAYVTIAGDDIKAKLQSVDDFIQNIFAADFTNIFGPVLGEVINGFLANIANVWDAILLILNGNIDFIQGVFTGNWEQAWLGIQNIFRGIFEGLTSIAKVPLNGVISLLNMAISAVNALVRGFNSLGFTLPDWLGGGSWYPSLPTISSIPYLAKGGTLHTGSAVVGEAGAELLTIVNGGARVTPLTDGEGSTGTSYGDTNITLTVNGAAGQSVDAIADRVMTKINTAVTRKGGAFA